jgi:hypothetical protein
MGMDTVTVNQLLTIFAWFPLAALLSIMLLIGRFYQNLTGENTRYTAFVVPIILFAVAAAHYASTNRVMGSMLGDLLLFVGGIVLIGLCAMLYRQMTVGR